MDDEDPIVAEVRRAREEIAAMCNYDDDLIHEYVHQRAKAIREQWNRQKEDDSAG